MNTQPQLPFEDLPTEIHIPGLTTTYEAYWTSFGLHINRVKIAHDDENKGEWKILWAAGRYKGQICRVILPFNYAPKDFLARRKFLYARGNEHGVMVNRTGLLENGVWSTKH